MLPTNPPTKTKTKANGKMPLKIITTAPLYNISLTPPEIPKRLGRTKQKNITKIANAKDPTKLKTVTLASDNRTPATTLAENKRRISTKDSVDLMYKACRTKDAITNAQPIVTAILESTFTRFHLKKKSSTRLIYFRDPNQNGET